MSGLKWGVEMARWERPSDEWQFLKNVGSNYELELITSILAREGILVMKKSQGSGAYTDIIMGASLTGYDIYVPAKRLAEAREIIDNLPVFEADEIDFNEPAVINSLLPTGEEEPGEGFILRNRNFFKVLLIVFVLIPIIFGFAVALFTAFPVDFFSPFD